MEYINVFIRTGVIFCLIMAIIRMLGKREVGELSIFDLVVLLVIANVGSICIDDSKLFATSIVGLVSIFLLQKIFTFLVVKFARLRNISDGSPRIIIMNGILNYEAMKKELYTVDDLVTQMRYFRIMDISEIQLAILETNGVLSVFKKVDYNYISLPIILSGVFESNVLEEFRMNKESIKWILDKESIKLRNIFYATTDGLKLYVYSLDKKNRKVEELRIVDLLLRS